jgi:beta-lactam-binding protein with PASTA domain
VAEGRVIEQDPNRDTYVDPGTTVSFVVSSGKPMVTVPFVANQSKNDVRDQLEALGFKVRLKEEDTDQEKDTVTRTDPAAGESVPQGSTITVFYSDGPEEIPNVVNLQQDEAEQKLRDAGFEPSVLTSDQTDLPAGTVISQSPTGGQTANQGATVTIVVSSYQPPPSSPTDTTSPSDTSSPLIPTTSP